MKRMRAAEVCRSSTLLSTRKETVGRRGGPSGQGTWEFLKTNGQLDLMTENPQACPKESPCITIHDGN